MSNTSAHWVFLHGTPLSPTIWHPIADRIRDRATTVSCPSLDSRGDSVAHATRIATALPDTALVNVVGHSFGGQVGIDLALILERDGRLGSLGVICSRATPFPAFAPTAGALRNGQAPDVDAAIARWFTPEERRENAPLVDYATKRLQDTDPQVWADALDSIARFDRSSELAQIFASTTLIAAEFDTVSPPDVMAEMASRLPRARLEVLRGTGHLGPFLRPEVVVDLLQAGAAD
jgi:pimeloyl-ACP methyl ester carboxylesterase